MRSPIGLAGLAALTLATAGAALTAPDASAAPSGGPDDSVAAALEALDTHPRAARTAPGQAFVVTDTVTDPDGTTHVRMERTFRGLPVLGGDLVVHQDVRGSWRGVSQTLRAPVSLRVRPQVRAAAAEATALAPRRETRGITGDTRAGEPRLVVDAAGARPRLAWEVVTGGTQADGTPSRLATYVDARTGSVLRSEQQIHTADGQGHSLYSGTVPLQVTPSGSSYQLKDPTRGGTYTTDMNNAQDSFLCQLFGWGCRTGTLFTSTDTTFGDGTTGSRESAAVDAMYGTNVTWDYFQDVHGRDGIFGDGTGSYNRVHYGTDYVNAFWDGEKMTYGDGDGVSFGPLVSLDVAGHEMTHGVTQNTANLTYSGESGGLNEATSDIFGTLVEFHAQNPADPGDYLIGEEFDLQEHRGFRRMDDPASDGSSQGCWTSSTKDLDVHHSSGVGNHFFYLLAEGSGTKTFGGVTHTSTTCDGSTVTGIGRAAAAAIWFRALDVYMTSSTNYAGARRATLDAARDLFGSGSTQHATVAAAWSAVSVG